MGTLLSVRRINEATVAPTHRFYFVSHHFSYCLYLSVRLFGNISVHSILRLDKLVGDPLALFRIVGMASNVSQLSRVLL